MTKKQQAQEEAKAQLRQILTPGQTVYTVLKSVSRSGMYRRIAVLVAVNGGGLRNISGLVATVEDSRWHDDNSVGVGGCGMDMGFHIVHNLGYALYGQEASEGKGKDANKLRRKLLAVDRFYYTQGGTPAPNPNKPDRLWFGGSGYAFKHSWL